MEFIPAKLIAAGVCKEAENRRQYIETEHGRMFVKFSPAGNGATPKQWFDYQELGLKRMRELTSSQKVHIPKPYMVGLLEHSQPEGEHFLAMEYIELYPARSNLSQEKLGQALAHLHLQPTHKKVYGFDVDGCCGASEQLNNAEGRRMNWVEFWSEFRLGHQLAMAKENYPCDVRLQERGAELLKRLPELFSMLHVEDIAPALLHGDLWAGNVAVDIDNTPVMIDPAAYYGHSEADLGIARMFSGFSTAFWDAYHKELPPAPGFARRALLYNLHHALNHYNIFGSLYRDRSLALMDRILDNSEDSWSCN